ncbi:anaphase-promoting complex subunit Apc4 [Schizosaccharomyces japonicus yFS275]|uniref:Anaphase-promoting complex subunit 4 n=1 Tax=Schizosaccharomyces japonicus (strain yFS275 / FY16936) TaxID=402676 RepID=B6K1S4_SCHJY|nr:anaphase-promoting complex subunit Apc4 [Schizosaccharomyces japonicus yFS275]EEB07105.1 anaphase-promoting complex subunit Apc4 [Schizosaccharomyces japonicus yFS275]
MAQDIKIIVNNDTFKHLDTNWRHYTVKNGIQLLSLCPTMDLQAFVTDANQLYVCRRNGHIIWELKRDETVTALCWHFKGEMLAVGYGNGEIELLEVVNGRTAEKIQTGSTGRITSIAWSVQQKSRKPSLQDLSFDATVNLPLLGALPSSSLRDCVFSSKVLVEHLATDKMNLNPNREIELMSVFDDHGYRLANMFGTYKIGQLSDSNAALKINQPISHACSRETAHHYLVSLEKGNAVLKTLYMPLLETSPQHLVEVATLSTRMQYLVKYISETSDAMYEEYKNFQSTQQKVTNMFETINSKNPDRVHLSPQAELYQFYMTGIPSWFLREWLADRLADRGLKSWEKKLVNSYRELSRLVIEHLLPACERLTVYLNILRGKASWGVIKGSSLLDTRLLDDCIVKLCFIHASASKLLLVIQAEEQYFTDFINWLIYALAELTSVEPRSVPPQQHINQAGNIVHYIKSVLFKSEVELFFHSIQDTSVFDLKSENVVPDSTELFSYKDESTSPPLNYLTQKLTDAFNLTLNYPSSICQRQWQLTSSIVLGKATDNLQVRFQTFSTKTVQEEYTLLFVPESEFAVVLYSSLTDHALKPYALAKFTLDEGALLESIPANERASISSGGDSVRILDATFVKSSVLILVRCHSYSVLAQFSVDQLLKQTIAEGTTELISPEFPVQTIYSIKGATVFNGSFLPELFKYCANVDRASGILVSKDRKHYRLFAVD